MPEEEVKVQFQLARFQNSQWPFRAVFSLPANVDVASLKTLRGNFQWNDEVESGPVKLVEFHLSGIDAFRALLISTERCLKANHPDITFEKPREALIHEAQHVIATSGKFI